MNQDYETSIDWNPFTNNYTTGTKLMVEGDFLHKRGEYKKAVSKLKIAISRFESCSSFLKMYKLPENVDVINNIESCKKAIEKCNLKITQHVKIS